MATVGELVVKLSASTASFASDMGKARQISFNTTKEIERSWKLIGGIVTGAAVAAGASIIALTKAAITNADHMGKAAQATGLSVEAFSGFAYAAKLADVPTASLSTALVALSKNLQKSNLATQEGRAAHSALSSLFRGAVPVFQSTEQAFSAIADQLSKLPDGYEKTALAAQIFGRAGASLIPLLNEGAAGIKRSTDEAKVFGVVVSGEVAKQAERFNDNLTRLATAAQGFAARIASAILPALVGLTNALVNVTKAASANADAFQRVTSEIPVEEYLQLTHLAEALAAVQKKLTPIPPPDLEPYAVITEAGQKIIEDLKFQVLLFGQSAGEAERLKASRLGALLPEQQIIAALASQLDALEQQAIKHKEIQRAIRDSIVNMPKPSRPIGQTLPIDFGSIVKAAELPKAPEIKFDIPIANLNDFASSVKGVDDQLQAQADLLNRENRPAIEKYNEEMAKIQLLQGKFGLSAGAAAIEAAKLKEQLSGTAPIAVATRQALDEMFTQAIFRSGSFVQALGNVLQRMAELIFQVKVLDPLLNNLFNIDSATGKSNGGSGVFGKIFGSIAGAIGGLFGGSSIGVVGAGTGVGGFGIPLIAGRASGGSVSGGMPYMVGERGPEYFVPNVSGRIIPNGGMGAKATFVFNVDARGADAGIEQRVYKVLRDTAPVIVDNAVAKMIDLQRRTA